MELGKESPQRSRIEKKQRISLIEGINFRLNLRAQESGKPTELEDVEWADFSDCTDDWQSDPILETVSDPILSAKKVLLVRRESGWWLIARIGEVEIVEYEYGDSFLAFETSFPISAEDKETALYLAEVMLRVHKAIDVKGRKPWHLTCPLYH